VEKAGIVHASIGRKSMGADKLKENFLAFMGALLKAKPASSKGVYLRGISMSSTMGAGLRLDVTDTQSKLS
jgi:large subunit ribosomal protein L1